jgi:hypothetical protein
MAILAASADDRVHISGERFSIANHGKNSSEYAKSSQHSKTWKLPNYISYAIISASNDGW